MPLHPWLAPEVLRILPQMATVTFFGQLGLALSNLPINLLLDVLAGKESRRRLSVVVHSLAYHPWFHQFDPWLHQFDPWRHQFDPWFHQFDPWFHQFDNATNEMIMR